MKNTTTQLPLSFVSNWCKLNASKDPALKYMSTLGKKNELSSMRTLADLVNLPEGYKGVKMLNLLNAIETYESEICLDYEKYGRSVVLGSNCSELSSIADRCQAVVSEYIAERTIQNEYEQHYYESTKRELEVCKETYQSRPRFTEPTGRGILAKRLGVDRVQIDNYVIRLRDAFRTLLVEGKAVGRFTADPDLVAQMRVLASEIGNAASIPTVTSKTGAKDGKSLQFILDTLGYSRLIDSATSIPVRFVCKDRIVTAMKAALGSIIAKFRHEPTSIRVDGELVDWLAEIEDETIREAFRSLILNSEEFTITEEDGEQIVSLRWDLLQTIPARVCAILHANKAFDFHSAMNEEQILDAYNRLARIYGEKPIKAHQLPTTRQRSGCPWRLFTIGNSRHMMLRDSRSFEFSLDGYIRSFIQKGGESANVNELVLKAKAEGIIPIYTEKTVRARFFANGGELGVNFKRVVSEHTVTFYSQRAKEEIVDKAASYLKQNGETISMSELWKEICPEANYTTFALWIKTLGKGRFTIKDGIGRTPTYLCSSEATLNTPKGFREKIWNKAVETLSSRPGHQMLRSELYDILKPYVPSSSKSSVTEVSKVINSNDTFEVEGCKSTAAVVRLTHKGLAAAAC